MAGADGVIAEFNSWDHKFDAGDEVFFSGCHVVDAMNGRRTTLRVEKGAAMSVAQRECQCERECQ